MGRGLFDMEIPTSYFESDDKKFFNILNDAKQCQLWYQNQNKVQEISTCHIHIQGSMQTLKEDYVPNGKT